MSAPPPYAAHDRVAQPSKFGSSPTYQDVPWAIAFFIQLVLMVVVTIAYTSKNSTQLPEGQFHDLGKHIVVIILTWILASIAVAAAMLWVIRTYGGALIWFTLIAGCVFTLLFAIVLFSSGSVLFGVIFFILFLLNCLYVYFVRNRIPFAAAIMQTAVDVINKYPATLVVSFTSLFVQAAWSIIWTLGATFVLVDYDNRDSSQENSANASAIFLVFSFYWTSQVISGVVLVTVAGVCAEWFFRSPDIPEGVTTRSLKRACTTSLGSIAFGSFIVSAVKTLKFFVQQARQQDNGIMLCIAECILQCLQDIINYINLYAYTYVAVYGMSYCDAGKSVWQLFSSRGWDVIINDDLIGGVLSLGSFVAGVIVALISFGVSSAVNTGQDALVAFLGFVLGMIFTISAFVVVQAGVSCIMVCYAEDPQALAVSNPAEYNKLTDAFRKRYGESVRF